MCFSSLFISILTLVPRWDRYLISTMHSLPSTWHSTFFMQGAQGTPNLRGLRILAPSNMNSHCASFNITDQNDDYTYYAWSITNIVVNYDQRTTAAFSHYFQIQVPIIAKECQRCLRWAGAVLDEPANDVEHFELLQPRWRKAAKARLDGVH